ncbi:maltose regulon regulatory protein MalI [Bifidobacterium dolichotidis]|uniref:Maltose regulon regulatory protein MalI n=1 Tax=Bifidobacterium dolichotidis TaxID=2306976 RepID=A0A430FQM6_9BIFI|nr:LacI family DNA-binding transcriptional regulator [Bifidobacterium dolichotidis]RSX55143.1 maltose regulon regulatory protein MalI [Bifidobacterium dolichotidis]
MASQRNAHTPASINDVAALARVSIATVSRVLSGKRTKEDDIARRVRDAAAELDYSVNRSASALRGADTKTLGLIVPSASRPFCGQLINALEEAADDRGYQLFVGVGSNHALQNARFESLLDRNVDGMIIVPAEGANVGSMAAHHPHRLPVVQIGGRHHAVGTSLVSIDPVLGMEELIVHLSAQGVRSVATLMDKQMSFEAAEQLSMLHTQLRSYSIETETRWHTICEPTMSAGFYTVVEMFTEPSDDTADGITSSAGIAPGVVNAAEGFTAGHTAFDNMSTKNGASGLPILANRVVINDHPDAIICYNERTACGAITALTAMGLHVPNDVCVVTSGFSHHKSITGLEAPFGRIVAESLRLIGNGPDYSAHISLPPTLSVQMTSLRRAGDRTWRNEQVG